MNVTKGTLQQGGVNVATEPMVGASAYLNGGSTVTFSTTTVLNSTSVPNFNEEFDPQGIYVPTTGVYTPTRAGYYLCSLSVYATNLYGIATFRLRKNGSTIADGSCYTTDGGAGLTKLVYCNGSTDTLDFAGLNDVVVINWGISRLSTSVVFQGT